MSPNVMMNQQFKERIIGAIVLVSFAVVFVPMYLDGPDPVAAGSDDPGVRQTASASIQVLSIPLAEPKEVAIDEIAAAMSSPTAQSVILPEPAAEPQRKTGVQAEGTASLQSGWAVQVGSFGSEANAELLASQLSEQGYPAFVARGRIDGRNMHRVRVGPEADRSRAEALASRLRRDGHSARIVEHP